MNKKIYIGALALGMSICSASASAEKSICVFDLLGRSGESFKALQAWALNTNNWGTTVKLVAYQQEAKADEDFKAGRCDGVFLTSMRARQYNRFAGSIDALGAVPTADIAKKAIAFALDKRNQQRLVSTIQKQNYEVAGITQIGAAYIFVKDKKMNSIEHIAGKKFAVLHYDEAQRMMVQRIGGIAVNADINNFVTKFQTGDADIIAAPAYAYKALEIQKGLTAKGTMIDFPVVNVTADLILRQAAFAPGFAEKSRAWFVEQIPASFAMVKRMEADIPTQYRLQLNKTDKEKYQRLLRQGRLDLREKGIYDARMMTMLKRARCTVESTNFECSLAGE